MAEIKTKFMDLLHKQTNRQIKIPAMGFSEYLMLTLTSSDLGEDNGLNRTPQHQRRRLKETVNDLDAAADIDTDNDADTDGAQAKEHTGKLEKSDQEILESIDSIYFRSDNSQVELDVLQKVLDGGVNYELINSTITQLRQQHKILSKQVLQNILKQRGACDAEFAAINNTRKELEESLWICRKSRSYLNYARTHLTTISLEILASYRKREILKDLLKTLQSIKKLKFTDIEVEKLLGENNYSGAISLLIDSKDSASEFMEYNCVQSLHKKLQETLLMTEYQLDVVLNEIVFDFNIQKYAKLQEAYKLLNKSLMAMDQLHINFISAIHSSVNSVLRGYIENDENFDENVKYLYEQLCEQIKSKQYISCLISLCKTFWTILSSYYQIVIWHQNYKLYPLDIADSPDLYIQEKLKKGQSRIWNDILNKICIYLQSSTLITLKYDQFIQVLAIIQRLKKVGIEFCGEHSEKVIEIMRLQSEKFFQCYHIACLEEICLFLDNESWTIVDSFTNILQLAEFRCISYTFKKQITLPVALLVPSSSANDSPVSNHNCDDLVSVHSQDASSSIYGSYGYFLRFSEKSSPFDGGLDVTMLEEDILSGIVDEASCYFSEESEDERKSLHSKDEDETCNHNVLVVNNTALNVFRCIGRYLQMCKLLHCISPKIVASMLELIDFYIFAIHEMFGKDVTISTENSAKLEEKLENVKCNVIPNIKIWPINFSSLLNNELANPDTLYGLSLRVVAVASCHCISQQFQLLLNYLNHLLHNQDRFILNSHMNYTECTKHLSRLIYANVTSRALDLPAILTMISKVKWNINHVSFQHSSYVDIMNRNVQNFAMRLEEVVKEINVPIEQLWNSVACVAAHVFVEGFSSIKKCSAGGRALMQLDFTNFMSILELISNQKFPDYRSYVDTLIKVYYLSFENFEEWITAQNNLEIPQYTKKQLMNLIQCKCVNDKRIKQKLLNLLDNSNSTGNSSNNSNTALSAFVET